MPQDAADRWTVRKLLGWTTEFLGSRGSESPRLDAEVLLSFALGWKRVEIYTHFDDEVDDEPKAVFRDLVKRRSKGTPVAYLVGSKEFYVLTFKVNPSVLIPRPDSEYVVVEFLNVAKGKGPIRAVDVGTGSGCLALACSHSEPKATFFATDISPAALEVAALNAASLGLAERVTFRQGSLLGPVQDEEPFDIILSNPPYIKSGDLVTLDMDVRGYEPAIALDGGEDGLRVIEPLVEQSIPLLKVGGHLILEIGYDIEDEVRRLIESKSGFSLAPTIRDLGNQPRVIRATRTD